MNPPTNPRNSNASPSADSSDYGVEDIRDWKYRQLLNEFNRERSAAMQVGQEAPLMKLTVESGKPCPCARKLAKIRVNPVAPLDQQADRLPPFPECPPRCNFCHITPTEYKSKGPGLVSQLCSGMGKTIAFLIKIAILLAVVGAVAAALWIYQPWKQLPNDIPVVSDYLKTEEKAKDTSKSETKPADDPSIDTPTSSESKTDDVADDSEANTNDSAENADASDSGQEKSESKQPEEKTENPFDSAASDKIFENQAEIKIPNGYRLWTDEDGEQVVGKFIKYQIKMAFVEEYETKQIKKIPMKNLTDDDKEYLRPLIQKQRNRE